MTFGVLPTTLNMSEAQEGFAELKEVDESIFVRFIQWANGDDDSANTLAGLIASFGDVFTDSGKTIDIPEAQWMPVTLKPGAKAKASRVYPLGQKDRQVVGESSDKLHTV